MTGPKLNEATRSAGVSSGTRASAMYVRMSASKVRVVLNLIRGLEVQEADSLLQFLERDSAHVVRKLLASAVANATFNDEKDGDTLYVKACFADEGPTLKRFRPRAKGRAGAILKRTCHVTIIVETMTDRALAVRQQRDDAKGTSRTTSRAARVSGSRARAQKSAPVVEADEVVGSGVVESDAVDSDASEQVEEN